MDGDTGLPSPGDLVGGNIPADGEGSVLWCRCQLSCIHVGFYTHECATMGTYRRRLVDMLLKPKTLE